MNNFQYNFARYFQKQSTAFASWLWMSKFLNRDLKKVWRTQKWWITLKAFKLNFYTFTSVLSAFRRKKNQVLTHFSFDVKQRKHFCYKHFIKPKNPLLLYLFILFGSIFSHQKKIIFILRIWNKANFLLFVTFAIVLTDFLAIACILSRKSIVTRWNCFQFDNSFYLCNIYRLH